MELKLDIQPWRGRRGMAALRDALGAAEGLTRYVGGAVRDQLLGLTSNELPDRLNRTIERVQALAPANGMRLNVRNFGTKVDGEEGREGWRWQQTLTNPQAWGGTPESWQDYARVVNGEAPFAMALAAARRGMPFVHVSTDYVFDGAGTEPFAPESPTAP